MNILYVSCQSKFLIKSKLLEASGTSIIGLDNGTLTVEAPSASESLDFIKMFDWLEIHKTFVLSNSSYIPAVPPYSNSITLAPNLNHAIPTKPHFSTTVSLKLTILPLPHFRGFSRAAEISFKAKQ